MKPRARQGIILLQEYKKPGKFLGEDINPSIYMDIEGNIVIIRGIPNKFVWDDETYLWIDEDQIVADIR